MVLIGKCTEEQIIAAFAPGLPVGRRTLLGPGDDCAIVSAPDGRFVVSTDVLVEERHFRRCWSTAEEVGRRAAAQNLADIAAMGAVPTALVCSLVLPTDLPLSWVTGFARGLAQACAPVGCGVVGGDIASGPQVVAAVTVHGDLEGRPALLRSGARAGDQLAIAGEVGFGAAGWALAERFGRPGAVPAAGQPFLQRFLVPEPPLAAGTWASRAGARAAMDISDGLVRDGMRLARASAVSIELFPQVVDHLAAKLLPAAELLGAGEELTRRWVLGGGEDHGLLVAFPAGAPLPESFFAVGVTSGGEPGRLTIGAEIPEILGWTHFA